MTPVERSSGPSMSVVVQTHGRVDLFVQTLSSLSRQTLTAFEVIVTDDSHDEADRRQIEEFLGTRVYLGLFVKVKERWREDTRTLEEMGLHDGKPEAG